MALVGGPYSIGNASKKKKLQTIGGDEGWGGGFIAPTAVLTGGNLLLSGETEGLGIDFTVATGLGSVAVKDAGTPANNKSNAAASTFLTNSSASVKWVLGSNGLYSAAAAGIVFEYEPSTGGYYGLCEAVAATNVVLWNRDLTNAAWTASNVTVAKDQTGVDGVANSASSLTATAGNGTVLQAITLASSVRWQSAFVRRITGSGAIQMTMDNGSTWTAVTVTSAWARVTIPTQTLANPTVGFRIVTSGDAIAVDMVQNESGAAWDTYSSPIPTTTVAVTRAADVWTSTASAFPIGTTYTYFIDYSIDAAPVDGFTCGVSNDTDNEYSGQRTTSIYIVSGGSLVANITPGAGGTTPGHRQISARIKLNDAAASIGGAAVVADTSCTVPTVTRLCFGRHRLAGTTPWRVPLKLRRYVYVPRGVIDADLPNWRYL